MGGREGRGALVAVPEGGVAAAEVADVADDVDRTPDLPLEIIELRLDRREASGELDDDRRSVRRVGDLQPKPVEQLLGIRVFERHGPPPSS